MRITSRQPGANAHDLRAAALAPRAAAVKISVRRIAKQFPFGSSTVEALRDVEFTVAPGEFCCIVGPSGCGKTTLLRILGGSAW